MKTMKIYTRYKVLGILLAVFGIVCPFLYMLEGIKIDFSNYPYGVASVFVALGFVFFSMGIFQKIAELEKADKSKEVEAADSEMLKTVS